MTGASLLPSLPIRRQVIALALIFAAGALLRFYQITRPSLWMDEIWSVEMAMGRGSLHDHLQANVIEHAPARLTDLAAAAPWWNICTRLGGVTHPPLYFIVLRWWMDLFGTGAAAIRSLSVLFSLATLLIIFDLGRLLHGPRIALLAAAIFAVAGGQLDFAQDARSYPMLIFLGMGCADLVVRVEFLGATTRRLTALTILLIAAALTHYLCAGALLALALYAAIRLRERVRRQTIVAFAIAAALSLAVWIPLFLTQKHTLPSLAPTFLREAHADEHAKLTLYRIIGLPTEFLIGESRGEALSSDLVLAIFLFTMILPAIRLIRRRDLLLWVLWTWGTIGFVAVMDLMRQTTLVGYPRYTILASPAIYAAIAAFDWPKRPFVRDAVALACIALLTVVAIQRAIDGVSAKEDWRTLAADIDSAAAPDDLLVFYNADPWVSSGTWYMGLEYYAPHSHRPWLILHGPADATLLRQLESRRCLWLIGLYPEVEGSHLLPGWQPQLMMETTAGKVCRMIPTGSVIARP
jgi:mannosyltransferase